MQIVLIGNRVVAHGENCFLSMGGTVICEDTGKAFSNATVAEVDAIPADIDTVGYEYRAGVFVPCAPYGVGAGALMVACEECGTPKRSKVTADADGSLNVPGYLKGGKIGDEVSSALGLSDATVDEALGKLSEATLAKQIQVPDKLFLRDWDTTTCSSIGSREVNATGYGNGKFIALPHNSNIAVYSTDGISWESTTLPASKQWNNVVYGAGKFVAVGYSYTNAIYSEDGITWHETPLPSGPTGWRGLAYGNGVFVTLGSESNVAAYSSDGITWESATLPTSKTWSAVAFGNGMFMAVRQDYAAYSIDGKTWTKTTGSPNIVYDMAYGNGKFVVVSGGYESNNTYSTDGAKWTYFTTPKGINRIVFADGVFVGSGNDNTYLYSDDGITWTQGTAMAATNRYAIAYGDGTLVSFPNGNSEIAYSKNTYKTQLDLTDTHDVSLLEPLAEALGGVKIETGSYTGTGTKGSSSPTKLTFSSATKMVYIIPSEDNNYSTYLNTYGSVLFLFDPTSTYNGVALSIGTNSQSTVYFNPLFSDDGKTLTFYSDNNAAYQMNASESKYIYFAVLA